MKNKRRGISKRAARNMLLVIILAAIGGYIFLGITYNSDRSEEEDLEDEIAQQEPLKEQLEKQRGNLNIEGLIEEANEELEAQKARFPANMFRLDVAEVLMDLVSEADIEISESEIVAGVEEAHVEEIEGREYYVVPFNLTPTGSYQQVMDFIDILENGEMENISIEYVTIAQSGGVWGAPIKGKFYSRVEATGQEESSSNSTG